ncbi:MAG: AMP-binding protein [Paludibacteraceae bacterium]|nr:AMP-binding protein [Paludibacteraceae bacterium]
MTHYLKYIEYAIHASWNEPALLDFNGNTRYTYGEMAQKVAWLNILFEKIGLQKGDRIAICGRNCSNWAVAYLAIAAYKGVVVSILPDFTSDSIHELVRHSEARAMFVGPWVKGRLDLDKMPEVETFIAIEDFSIMRSKNPVEIEETQQLFDARFPKGLCAEDVSYPADNIDDVALINYTSGSTGSPKGVMVTNKNLSTNVLYARENIPNGARKSVVSMLPLAHMFGLMFEFIFQMASGACIYFVTQSPTPSILMKAFAEVRPYMILTVPLVIEKIFKKSIFPALEKPLNKILWHTPLINLIVRRQVYRRLMAAFGGQVEYLIIGGAALSKEVDKCLHKIRFPYTCGYGMTECAPLACYAHWKTYKQGSCGRAVDRLEIRIDSENPRKIAGELLLRGDAVMRGYYKNMQATDNIFTEDGWMRTGDMGIIDRKGNVFLRGRSKNMILGASGQNIYPEEIEDKLNTLEGVAESIVVERDGQLVGLVYPEPAIGLDTDKLMILMETNLQKLNKLLPNFSKVSSLEMVEKEFEKTPKKSIKRFLYK